MRRISLLPLRVNFGHDHFLKETRPFTVERFFFHLRRLLNTDDIERLRKIVDSSRRLSDLLVKFSREAGKHFEVGDITTNVLAFASASLVKTGKGFSYRRLPTLTLDRWGRLQD